MSTKKKIEESVAPAVFARNHRRYIDAACERNKTRPDQQTTFRAATTWRSAHYALQIHKALTCYLVPIGGEKLVEYQAVIHHIKLSPSGTDPETRNLLGFSLEETMQEGLWEKYGKGVNTLYTITHCQKLPVAFPITELTKIDDNKPISENYGYSYSLVYEHTPPAGEALLIAPEEAPYETDLFEGEARKASITARLRSAKARQKCLGHYGYNCAVCGFNFEKQYGQIGKGFIHVHHLASLAKGPERRKVDPLEDLRPVCPNCHAMLHSRSPELSIEELRKKMRSEP